MRLVAVLLVSGVLAGAARADVLVLADGKRIEGRLVSIDAHDVTFAPDRGESTKRPRSDVSGVLFYERAKTGPAPEAGATDRVEGDALKMDGEVLRVERSEFSHFGLTKLAMLTPSGTLAPLVTPRRIASIAFAGAAAKTGQRAAPKTATVLDPAKLDAAAEALLAGLHADMDVPAAIFGAESVLTFVTDADARTRLSAAIDGAKKLLPEHGRKRWSLGKVETQKYKDDTPAGGGEQFGMPSVRAAGREGFYVFAHLLTTTGELIGTKMKIAWRTKDGKTGSTTISYSTKIPMHDHVVAKGVIVGQSKVERVAVILLDGDTVLDSFEAPVGGKTNSATTGEPWWKNAPGWTANEGMSTVNAQTVEEHKTTKSVWEDIGLGFDDPPGGVPPFPGLPPTTPDGK